MPIYTIRIHCPAKSSQEVTIEQEHALLAVLDGLERLHVRTLLDVSALQIQPPRKEKLLEHTRPFPRIFLGGTCGNNPWRETIVLPGLLAAGIPEQAIFNPVVDHWDTVAQAREDQAKQDPACLLLYVLASPDPTVEDLTAVSGYSLVEAVMSLYDAPERTVVVFDTSQMARKTAKGMRKAMQDLSQRHPNAPIFVTYEEAIDWLVAHFPTGDRPVASVAMTKSSGAQNADAEVAQ